MAKILVFNEIDPAIGMILETVPPGTPGRAQGTYGTCNECGRVMHRWREDAAIRSAQEHVDAHVPQVVGIDPYSVIR